MQNIRKTIFESTTGEIDSESADTIDIGFNDSTCEADIDVLSSPSDGYGRPMLLTDSGSL